MAGQQADEPISIAGRPVHEVLRRNLSAVVSRMVARHRRELDDYRRLPEEVVAGDVTAISRAAVGYYVEWLRDGTGPKPAQLAHISQSAATRAEDGLALPAVLAAYVNGFQDVFQELSSSARPEDLPAVLALMDRIFDFIRQTTRAVATGYLDELRASVVQEHSARRALLDMLLREDLSEEAARKTGVRLSSHYLVLNLAVGQHPDARQEGVNSTIVARRMLRRVLAVFAAATDDQALASLQATGGVVLIPAEPELDWSTTAELVAATQRAAGATITVAAALVEPAGIPGAAVLTGEMLDVLRWFDHPAGLYQLDDILVEYQLTRPGEARVRLAAVLDPLQAHPELLDTLIQYVTLELNRRRTASLLHIHPNTVDYRLRRIGELTGTDATQPAGIYRLTAALAAQRAELPPAE